MSNKSKYIYSGFTLIELLAVIFLLLIIFMISTPSIKRMIDDANRLAESSVIERLVDAAKEYTTLYNKNLLNGLVVIGDKKNIGVNNLVNVGLIKKDDISSLKSNAYVVVELKDNSTLEYRVEFDNDLIEDNTLFIALLGKSTYYLLQGTPFIDPGWIAFDSNGNNITNKVVVTGNDFDVNVIGMNVITYTVTDNDTTVSVTRNVIVIDPTYPEVTSAMVISNNTYNNKRAKNGDTVTLSLTFSKEVTDPKVTIGGRVATVTGSGNTRTATYTIPSDENLLLDGELNIRVSDYQDKYSNNGAVATSPTTGGLVIYDKTAPSVAVTSIVSNNSNNKFAKNGNTLTLSITFSETVTNPTVTIGGRTATVTGSGNTRTATYTIPTGEASITEGNVAISISGYRDETGHFGNTFTNITTGGNVVYDRTPPSCTSSGGNTAWTNGSRTLTGTCSDSLSGCVGNVTKTYSTEINSTTESPGTVSDKAGNSTTCPANQTVRIDKTAPSVTCTKSNAGTETGVTATVTATDNLSGIASGTGTFTGVKSTTTYTIKDNAGNSSTCSVTVTTQTQYRYSNCSTYVECTHANCGCKTYGNYTSTVTYPSSCTASGSSGDQTYTTCSVNAYNCDCKCYSPVTTWTTKSNRCSDKCRSEGSSFCTSSITGTQVSVSTYIKTVYTGTCVTNKSCRIEPCGCETWGSWSSWSTTSCTSSGNSKKCESRIVYN